MLFISEALAQTEGAPAAEPSALASMLPLILIFAVFYFLLIRPQHKKMKAHEELVNSLAKGAEVITAGGIYGKITKVDEEKGIAHVEIAKDIVIKIKRSTILDVASKDADKVSKADKASK